MADQGRWFKLWTSAPEDPDLGNLSLEDFARWCLLGVYLKVHGSDGQVVLTPPATAFVRALHLPDFDAALDFVRGLPNCTVTLVTNSPVTCTVTWSNWAKYQGDYSGDRVRQFRDKRRHGVTPKKRGDETKKRSTTTSPLEVPPAKVEVFEEPSFKIDPTILEALDRLKLFRPIARFRDPDWWQSMILAFPRIDHLEALGEAHGYLLNAKKPYRDLPAFVRNSFKRAQEEADR